MEQPNGSQRLFGTDGVRGVANREPMTPEVIYNLGRAAGYVFGKIGADTVLVGRDGRLSGDMLECALVAGLCSVGTSVCRVGIVPTPAIAHLTGVLSAQLGVMVSASHNAFEHNGVKFFKADGTKIDDDLECEIESAYFGREHVSANPTGGAIGRVVERLNLVDRYLHHVEQTVPRDFDLSGLTIVVDCGNGAGSQTTPKLLERFGAEVVTIHDTPNGLNINEACGSQHTAPLAKAVAAHLADVGVAYDGDADRAVFVDERGNRMDGDHVLAVCGPHLKERGRLHGDVLVTTVLGNLGLDLTLNPLGIQVARSRVGDRFVWEEMKSIGASLGGEQAGHIIFAEFASTGDGLITALQMLDAMESSGKPLSELRRRLIIVPQTTRDIQVSAKPPLEDLPTVQQVVRHADETLGDRGRVIVRYSGTEPLARVMIEGEDEDQINTLADAIAEAIQQEIGDRRRD
ncbi:MAG: phosphoglucosamine mutase [Armatimonadetes bacterium]|nr:phosphoglucosamine mutase [Armatimonadota bacterium]